MKTEERRVHMGSSLFKMNGNSISVSTEEKEHALYISRDQTARGDAHMYYTDNFSPFMPQIYFNIVTEIRSQDGMKDGSDEMRKVLDIHFRSNTVSREMFLWPALLQSLHKKKRTCGFYRLCKYTDVQ